MDSARREWKRQSSTPNRFDKGEATHTHILRLAQSALPVPVSNHPKPAAEKAPRLPREGACLGNVYAGNLGGNLAVQLYLARQGAQLTGYYHYVKDAQYDATTNRYRLLRLEGALEDNGWFVLTEADPGKEGDARVTGRFTGAFDDTTGAARGTWETPAGDKKLSFHFEPTDSLEQGRNPRFRLLCAPEADANEQVQLLIEGGKAIKLMGVDGESLGSDRVIFDPTSVSLRLLEGRPNLYWIRYAHRRTDEPGVASAEHQHDQVIRADNTVRPLFDKWTLAGYEFRGRVHSQEDITVSYRGSNLRAVETRWADNTPEPMSPERRCQEECGCAQESAEQPCAREACVRACIRELLSRVNSEASFEKTVVTVDATTGRTTLQEALWAKEYFPLQYRFSKQEGETALSFLVLDDGISGWMLVRKETPPLEGQDTPTHSLPDPENPGQVPAIAACWLYNRVSWNETDASRTFPPAPPDQARPNPFVPKECCTLEMTADGNRALLYEETGSDAKKPGRLLAMFDSPSGSCYSVNLERSGRWGKALALSANLEEQARTCRSLQTSADGSPTATESLDQQHRITLGSRVRVRPDPELGCGQLDRLPLGKVVSALKRTLVASRIDGAEDRWYQVEMTGGETGWVFGGLLGHFDQAHPEASYRQIVERHLASDTRSLGEEEEFLDFLANIRQGLPDSVVPDFELARLRGIARALDHFTFPTAPPPQKASWLAGMEPYVTPMNDGGPYGLSPGAYWALQERYRRHPAAERLAWAAARADAPSECEDSICAFVVTVRPLVRYLQQYPSGANAAEAVSEFIKKLDMLDNNLKANSMRRCQVADLGVEPDDRKTFRKTLKAATKALRQVKDAPAAAARQQIQGFLGPCVSASPLRIEGSAQ